MGHTTKIYSSFGEKGEDILQVKDGSSIIRCEKQFYFVKNKLKNNMKDELLIDYLITYIEEKLDIDFMLIKFMI